MLFGLGLRAGKLALYRISNPFDPKLATAHAVDTRSVPSRMVTVILSGNRFRRVDLAFYLFLTLMSILAVIATAVSCWPVR